MSAGRESTSPGDADIVSAEAPDVPVLANSMAQAFFEDPVMAWLLPDPRRRGERLRRFFELELRLVGLARGHVWRTRTRDGAAITTPPGRWPLPSPVALRHGLGFTRAFGARLPMATTLLALMEKRHPREPHYYFPYIGVAPASQGQGIGTRLMTPTLLRCDQLHVPAYLEATDPRNAALYERLGFEHLDVLRFAGSPPLLLMRRPPR